MPDIPLGPDPDQDPEIAAADWLLQDAPKPPDPPKVEPKPGLSSEPDDDIDFADPIATPTTSRKPVAVEPPAEGFDLAEPAPPAARRSQPAAWEMEDLKEAPVDMAAERQQARERASGSTTVERVSRKLDGTAGVDQIWSRGSEWGPAIVRLVCWSLGVLVLLYFAFVAEQFGLLMLILAAGFVGGLLLAYPIFITLERPVRMTPEQAARDFYGALSHHFPHYGRMWLLLSNVGKTSSRYATFERFRAYWVERQKQIRQGRPDAKGPLAFLVSEFSGEKSAGKTATTAKWKVQVFVRGHREAGPILTVPMTSGFTKGPDGMWYLDDGSLPASVSGAS